MIDGITRKSGNRGSNEGEALKQESAEQVLGRGCVRRGVRKGRNFVRSEWRERPQPDRGELCRS